MIYHACHKNSRPVTCVNFAFLLPDADSTDLESKNLMVVEVMRSATTCVQVTAVLACPDKASRAAKYWNWFHRYVGPRLRRWGDHRCDFGDQKVHCEVRVSESRS